MFKYIISFCFLFCSLYSLSQQEKEIATLQDTVVYKTGYGLRIGADISKPILAIFDKSYSGFEIFGDYRIKKNWYLAAELGYEEETTFEDFTASTAKGSFVRIGANYNAYSNWLDMNNEIFIGGRYGFSLFEQTLDSFTPNVTTGIVNDLPYFPAETIDTPLTETGLTAHWMELQLGMKVETFKNLFLGVGFSYKIMINVEDQKGFKTLYAPGFNRVFASNTGFGFFYTVSYLIPFVNK